MHSETCARAHTADKAGVWLDLFTAWVPLLSLCCHILATIAYICKNIDCILWSLAAFCVYVCEPFITYYVVFYLFKFILLLSAHRGAGALFTVSSQRWKR